MNNKSLDIIVPTFNEETILPNLIASLAQAIKKVQSFCPINVIIADGGSDDNTEDLIRKQAFQFIKCKKKGRGYQIKEAYEKGFGAFVVILHADHILHEDVLLRYFQKIEENPKCKWGIMGHSYDEINLKMFLVKIANAFRFKYRKIAFGDQGMFFNREILDSLGGFPGQELMEDVEVSMILQEYPSIRIGNLLISSSRRWKKQGFISYALLTNSILEKYIVERNGGKDRVQAAENARKRYEME